MRLRVPLKTLLTLGLLSAVVGCGFVPIRQIWISPESSESQSKKPDDLISAQIEVALKCLKPEISREQNLECQKLARDAYYLFRIDWADPDATTLFVNSLAFQIIRISSEPRYKEIIKRLATKDMLTNQAGALQILNTTQLYWQSYYKQASDDCRFLHPEKVLDQKALGSMMTAMALTSVLPGSSLRSTVPRYFRAFAVYAASIKAVDWAYPRLPFSQPRGDCQGIPLAPAQVVFYGNAKPRLDDINSAWLMDQLKEEDLKYSEASLLGNLALAIPIEMMANPSGLGAKVSQGILNGFSSATRFARTAAYLGSSAFSFAYVTTIFLILDQGLQYGIDRWQEADLLKALKQAASSVATPDKNPLASPQLLGQIRHLTERTVLTAHHYNQNIYSTQTSVMHYFNENELDCSVDQTRRRYQRRQVVAQMVLNKLRDSFDRGGSRGHQCLLAFEKYLALTDLMQGQLEQSDLSFYQSSTQAEVKAQGNPDSARQALVSLRADLAREFAQGDYCPQGPGLLLQLTSYLEAFPEVVRYPYQAHVDGLLEGLIISYKGSIQDFWQCPKR